MNVKKRTRKYIEMSNKTCYLIQNSMKFSLKIMQVPHIHMEK